MLYFAHRRISQKTNRDLDLVGASGYEAHHRPGTRHGARYRSSESESARSRRCSLALAGELVVATPGQIPSEEQRGCLGTANGEQLATWVVMLARGSGRALTLGAYLLPVGGEDATRPPAFIAVCFPPPDVPPGSPKRSPFGAKLYELELQINGVFGRVTDGVWYSGWLPYSPGTGATKSTLFVIAPARIAPAAVSLRARRSGKSTTVTGAVTQAGRPRAGATVTLFAGATRRTLKRRVRAKVGANGRFMLTTGAGTLFRVTAVAGAGAAPFVCAESRYPITCVNPTVNAFSVQSKLVRSS